MSTSLRCPSCGERRPAASSTFECGCGDLLDVHHDATSPPAARPDVPAAEDATQRGVWRFRDVVLPDVARADVVTLWEGETPLYASDSVSEWVGLPGLTLKHEGMNPSGSFKDRGMTVAITHARSIGARVVVCASTGNTAASMAAYAAHAGLRACLVLPEDATALGKVSQALAYGARTVMVRGDFDDALGLVRKLAGEGELYACNSLNPFRLEGQKTIVLELLAQRGWTVPDWIVFPAGNLGNAAAFGKALREAHELGWIDRLPRLAAVQAEGASPFHEAWKRGFQGLEAVRARTLATAIRIGAPVSYERAARSVRETGGVVAAVGDDAILEAKAVVDAAGLGAEPASCAAVAGARALLHDGTITVAHDVVCVLTGHVLKDAETTLAYHRDEISGLSSTRANRPVVIDSSLDALRSALSDS